jgi:hypothetical protein
MLTHTDRGFRWADARARQETKLFFNDSIFERVEGNDADASTRFQSGDSTIYTGMKALELVVNIDA